MIDPNSLAAIYCPKCGHQADECIHAEARVRNGWYCRTCGHFTPAIVRERMLEKSTEPTTTREQ